MRSMRLFRVEAITFAGKLSSNYETEIRFAISLL